MEQLQHAPFFRVGLYDYVSRLREVIAELLSQIAQLPPQLTHVFTVQIWAAYRYLAGSVSREIPYEVVYGLDLALADWIKAPPEYIVTTAFLPELNYHFVGVPQAFYRLADSELGIAFSQRVVQVALPQLYQHQPLNNCVLYHELGHFIDEQFGVSKMMALLSSGGQQVTQSQLSHHAEHFADLFAAMYVGEAVATMLDAIAPNVPASYSHPSTADRRLVVEAFLNGTSHAVVALCNQSLMGLGLNPLSVRYSEPNVHEPFDNVRPYHVQSHQEVHGLMLAGQKYLDWRLANLSGAWAHVTEGEAIRMINDLVEKSIRNWMVREKWAHVSTA